MVIEYSIEALEEDISPHDQFASSDEEADRKMVAEILEDYNAGNIWAWCCVKMTARVEFDGQEFIGINYLGCCSYASEEDFKEDCYDGMKDGALDDLFSNLRDAEIRGRSAKIILKELKEVGAI